MRLAYVTTYDALDVTHWSGVGHFIGRTLEQEGVGISYMGPLKPTKLTWLYEKGRRLEHLLMGQRYLTGRTARVAADYGHQVERKLEWADADIVFSPGSIPLSRLECEQPVVFWTDATFAGMLDYYPEYTNLCAASIRQGHALEQSALERCALAIYSSDWAARTALEFYDVEPRKIKVVPFGANLETRPTPAEVGEFVAARSAETCKLLFVSVAWGRKGGDKVLEIARQVRLRGIPVELAIVGEIPAVPLPEYAHAHGFVSKSTAEGARIFSQLLSASHFLLLPSAAEAFGLVPGEANAFGVPALTSSTGGLDSVVRDGINGYKFDPQAPAEAYAELIAKLWGDPSSYRALALGSYREFAERLNWGAAGRQMKALLETCI